MKTTFLQSTSRLEQVVLAGFEDAPAAYEHMASGSHLGKIVIAL